MKTTLPKNVLFFCLAMVLVLSACAGATPAATEPPPATVTLTSTSLPPTFTPTVTSTPTKTPMPTATPNVAATEQYTDFLALVKQVYDAGQISTLDGTYMQLKDFSKEYAREYGYAWSETGESAKDFIIRADLNWEVANQRNNSGCGFKFRQELVSSPGTTASIEYYYFAVLDALNGVLIFYPVAFDHKRASLVQKKERPELGANPYQAEFALVVSGTSAYTYVNGKFFTEHRLQSNFITSSGPLEYVILTGSDTDFGTRCKMTNVGLWVIEP